MSGDKRIFMQLGDGADFESSKSTEPKKEIQEQVQDFALEKLFDGIKVLDITGGMATIAMPIEILKFLKIFSNILDLDNEKGITR